MISLSIKEILPIIKSCDLSICNDSSFSHLSAALGIKTITLMADTPLIYGSYSSKMFPVIPDGEETVSHNTLGKEKINPQKIFDKIWVQPASGDAGGSLGAALALWHIEDKNLRIVNPKDDMQGSYLGPEYSQKEIEKELQNLGANFTIIEEDKLQA